ncbi:MAG: choice-of-anchor D domain-containing protein, partial [Bacteroidota bacterium]
IAATVVKTLEISNAGNADLEVGNFVLPSGYSVQSVFPDNTGTIAANRSVTFEVLFDSGETGVNAGTLSFTTNDEEVSTFELQLSGYVNLPPTLSVTLNELSVQSGNSIDLGSTVIGEALTATLVLLNDGEEELTLSNFSLNGDFTINEQLPALLAPGASISRTVSFTANNTGSFGGMVSFNTNDPGNSLFTLGLAVQVINAAKLVVTSGSEALQSGSELDFGVLTIGESSVVNLTLRNAGDRELTLSNLMITEPSFSVTGDFPDAIAPGNEVNITVQFSNIIVDRYVSELSFTNNDPTLGTFILNLTGEIAEEVKPALLVEQDALQLLTNDVLDFGSKPSSTAVTIPILVTNAGNAPLELSNFVMPEGYSLLRPFAERGTVEVGASVTLEIVFDATTTGLREGTMSFNTNDASNATFALRLTGFVTTPAALAVELNDELTPSGSVSNLGNVFLGETITATITIRNEGEEELELSNFALSNDLTIEGGFPSVIPGNSQEVLTMTFFGSTAGNYSGNLSFNTNDGNNDVYTLELTAQVLTPGMLVVTLEDEEVASGGAYSFGELFTGESATVTLSLRNSGNSDLTLSDLFIETPFTLTGDFPTVIAAREEVSLALVFSSNTAGVFTTNFSFATDDEVNPRFDLALTGTALAPATLAVLIDNDEILSGSTFDFGTAPAEEVSSTILTIQNNGDVSLELSNLTVEAPFEIVGEFPQALSARASATIEVLFSVEEAGEYTGDLSFNSNDSENTLFELTLTAVATPVTSTAPSISQYIKLYPNPTTDRAFVEITDGYRGEIAIIVSDLTGKSLIRESFDKRAQTETFAVSPGTLPAGIYQVTIRRSGRADIINTLIVK